MSKDTTMPTPTISEAELFAELLPTEIVECDMRGKIKSRQTVEALLGFPFEHIDFRMDDIGDGPLGHLEAISFELQTATYHVEKVIEAFKELIAERVVHDDSEGWREERYLPALEKGERVMGTSGWNDISFEVGDRRVHGLYRVEHDMITVIHNGQDRTTQVGSTPPEALARQLLRELAR